MKILILGAGVIGVTSAYLLSERGHEVEVIERQPAAGSETSFANGGQLSFSHAEPWANPQTLKHVAEWMFKKDAPLVLSFKPDPHMLRWMMQFLRNCTVNRSHQNSVNLLKLGIYSKQVMEKIRIISGVEYNSLRQGILHVYTCQDDLNHAAEQAEFQNKMSGNSHSMDTLDRNALLQKEPTLQYAKADLKGGIFCEMDETGDAAAYTRNLATICTREFGTKFDYNVDIQNIRIEKGRIIGVQTNEGLKTADAYVMALGSYSYLHLKQIGIYVPVYPMKGYSLTIPGATYLPNISITDNEHKIVVTRLGDKLRAAGTAEFAGYNTDIRDVRIQPILRATQQLFPHADYHDEHIAKWACLRPSTPNGLPLIGRTKFDNLFLNTGHGTLGWTQAAGSANLLADIMESRKPEITFPFTC